MPGIGHPSQEPAEGRRGGIRFRHPAPADVVLQQGKTPHHRYDKIGSRRGVSKPELEPGAGYRGPTRQAADAVHQTAPLLAIEQ